MPSLHHAHAFLCRRYVAGMLACGVVASRSHLTMPSLRHADVGGIAWPPGSRLEALGTA